MIILGIETSCDETAASLVKSGRQVLASTVASQLAVHDLASGQRLRKMPFQLQRV